MVLEEIEFICNILLVKVLIQELENFNYIHCVICI